MEWTVALIELFKKPNLKFSYQGKNIDLEQIFSASGLLPLLVKRADITTRFCFGYDLGADFTIDLSSLSGNTVQFDSLTPNNLRVLFISNVLRDIIKSLPDSNNVRLDELIYDHEK